MLTIILLLCTLEISALQFQHACDHYAVTAQLVVATAAAAPVAAACASYNGSLHAHEPLPAEYSQLELREPSRRVLKEQEMLQQ